MKGKRKTISRACTDKLGTPRPLGLHIDEYHKCIRGYMKKGSSIHLTIINLNILFHQVSGFGE